MRSTEGTPSDIQVYADAVALSHAIASTIVLAARESIATSGRFVIALSGGDTPRGAYELLGTRYPDAIDWTRVHVWFTDERFVPVDDSRNNFAMADRAWLSRVPIPRAQVHPIPTTDGTPADCADRYEALLRAALGGNAYTFDLALMGIGTDGHTASLFPGDDAALGESRRWVLAVQAPPGIDPRDRITLTLPVLNGSRRVVFAAAGAAKRERVAQARAGRKDIPAALVRGQDSTVWLVDALAA